MTTINISTFRSITIRLSYNKSYHYRHSIANNNNNAIFHHLNKTIPSSATSSSRHYFSTKSSSTTTTTTTETTTPSSSSSSSTTTSDTIFPWRHSTTILPRILTDDDLSGQPNNFRGRLIRSLLVARELDVSVWSILMGTWKEDLAQDMVWAWRMSLLGVLSKSFGVPMNNMDNPLNVDNSLTISLNTATGINSKLTPEQEEETNEFLSATLDSNLIQLYNNNTPQNNNNIQINFFLQPQSYKIQSAFLVPMFTRSHVTRNPNLKGAYSKIEAEFQKTASPKIIQQMANDLVQNELNGETGYRSVIVDVVVECRESFCVIDRSLDVLKIEEEGGGENKKEDGMGGGEVKEVTHLIRFEMETKSGAKGKRVLGNWKIIDWDDLLEGNVWH